MAKLIAGDKAPDFKAKNQNGEEIKLSDFKGKKVILFFYPKDDTPGCTATACNLRDNFPELKTKGYDVIGVSPDDVDSHGKFVEKYDLPFNLVADPEKEIMNAYGTWGEKNLYGKIVTGVLRTTYVIDEKGKIEKVINRVDTANHTEQLLKFKN